MTIQIENRAIHKFKTRVNIHDTDAAGIVYFANVLRIAHTAYEDYLTTTKYSFGQMVDEGKYMLPIVHAEADYKRPMKCGDTVYISVLLGRVGEHSFVLNYRIENSEGDLFATVQTVHVCVDQKKFLKTPLPEHFKEIFNIQT
jgi:1,4-dihydroxy-2-naphthoyl-CoA hydrolase